MPEGQIDQPEYEQFPLHWRERLWRLWLYRDYGMTRPFGTVPNAISAVFMILCCEFLPKWFWKLIGKRIREVGNLFKNEGAFDKQFKNFKYPLDQCNHCGINIPKEAKRYGVPSARSEWGDRILCERCYGWRTAIHESVKQGQLKLRKENET